jgi:hypothetical protein
LKEDEMCRACSTNELEEEFVCGIWWESQKESDYYEDQDMWVEGIERY